MPISTAASAAASLYAWFGRGFPLVLLTMISRAVLLLLPLAALAGCADLPRLPEFIGTPLPVSGTVVATPPGYGEALSGYLRGTIADMSGDTLRASGGYMATLVEDPDNLRLRERVFEMSLLEGDIPNALRLARTMPVEEGQAMPALVRAVGDVPAGRIGEARDEVRAATRVAPDLLQFRLISGYLALAQEAKGGAPTAAQVQAEVKALMDVPGPSVVRARKLYHVGRMWLKVGDTAKATAALEESNTLEKGALFTTLLLGNLYERAGHPDKAIELYRVFRAKNPQVALLEDEEARIARHELPPEFHSTLKQDMAVTLFDFGLLVWAQGAVTPARELLNLSLWLEGGDPYMLYYAGIVDEFAGATDKALAKYERIDDDSPVGLAARIRWAEALFRSGGKGSEARAKALDAVKRLERKRGDSSAVLRSVAEMSFDNKDFSTARDAYGKLIDGGNFNAQPNVMAALYFARGASEERLGRYEAAEKDLQMSLSLAPNTPSVLNYLGYMWAEHGWHVKEAIGMLQKALLLAPDDGATTDSLGWAYYMAGDYQTALFYLEKATDLTPDDPSVNAHLGDTYAKLGRDMEARRQWRRALGLLTPDNADDGLERQLKKKMGY